MDVFTTQNLSVSPFLICPSRFLNLEVSVIFGSEWLRSKHQEIISCCLDVIKDFYCETTAMVINLENRIVILQIMESNLLDERTKRQGLYLFYGAVIEKSVLIEYKNICENVFIKFSKFINKQTKKDNLVDGAEALIMLFQKSSSPRELIEKDILESLIKDYESEFYVQKRARISRLKIFLSREPKVIKKKPCNNIEETLKFWKDMDVFFTK